MSLHSTLSAAVLLTVTQRGEQAASEMERDCQGNKASRESQGQAEPTMKLEHTWAHGPTAQALAAELTSISINEQASPLHVHS